MLKRWDNSVNIGPLLSTFVEGASSKRPVARIATPEQLSRHERRLQRIEQMAKRLNDPKTPIEERADLAIKLARMIYKKPESIYVACPPLRRATGRTDGDDLFRIPELFGKRVQRR